MELVLDDTDTDTDTDTDSDTLMDTEDDGVDKMCFIPKWYHIRYDRTGKLNFKPKSLKMITIQNIAVHLISQILRGDDQGSSYDEHLELLMEGLRSLGLPQTLHRELSIRFQRLAQSEILYRRISL